MWSFTGNSLRGDLLTCTPVFINTSYLLLPAFLPPVFTVLFKRA
jgi:hypothetical protein